MSARKTRRGFDVLRDKSINRSIAFGRSDRDTGLVRQRDLEQGSLYAPLSDIRKISLAIAVAVATKAYEMGLGRAKRPRDLPRSIAGRMYNP